MSKVQDDFCDTSCHTGGGWGCHLATRDAQLVGIAIAELALAIEHLPLILIHQLKGVASRRHFALPVDPRLLASSHVLEILGLVGFLAAFKPLQPLAPSLRVRDSISVTESP